MTKSALVLGGGGIVGLAWETGLVAGLVAAGARLAEADSVIGTSAGSFVGAWLAAGEDPAARVTEQESAGGGARPETQSSGVTPDPAQMAEFFRYWAAIERFGPEHGRKIGELARRATTPPEAEWVGAIAGPLGALGWPATLRVSVVDTASGEVTLFDAAAGVPLALAVAASCSVPTIFPPVSIEGRTYVDGGVASGTHAHRALDARPQRALVIAALDRHTLGIGPLLERQRQEEVASLREAGVEVAEIVPSDDSHRAMGLNFMDVTRRGAAVQAGFEQGQREAAGAALESWRA